MAEKTEAPEREVEAIITKNTSIKGMMLQRGARHWFPLSIAKGLRDQGLAIPVPKVIPSHPPTPPPPPPSFEGEGDDESAAEEDEAEDEE